MIKVNFLCDELYPVYYVFNANPQSSSVDYEIDTQTLLRWESAYKEFYRMQKEISEKMGYGEHDDLIDMSEYFTINEVEEGEYE